ncbi:MAG: hypothetical protein WCF84_27095 [Anaerolineae bacterium]
MKSFSFALFLGFACLVVGVLIGCSPPAPVTMDSLPLATGAQPTTNGPYVQLKNTVTDGLKNAQGVQIDNIDSRIYTLDKTATWNDVQTLYDTQLNKGDWKTDPKLTVANASVHGKGWLRGQQVFAVFFISDPNIPDVLLLTALGTVKQ